MSDAAALCPACAAPVGFWAPKARHWLLKCRECGTVLAECEAATGAHDVDPYATYHEAAAFQAPPPVIARSLAAVLSSAEPYRRTGRWLDFGYGEGALLSAAHACGWSCHGVEVSPHALEHGQNVGWTVTATPATDLHFTPASFDVVSFIEVIEHLKNPVASLRQAVGWLRPGGLMYLTTPNARSLNGRLLGANWSIFCPPEHWIVWSPMGLRKALTSLGLRRVRIRTTGLNPVEIGARVRWSKRSPQVHRLAAATRLNEALSRSRSRRMLRDVANQVLNLLRLGDSLKAWSEKAE